MIGSEYANHTAVGLGGFLIAYCPLIFSILGFRDYGGNGAATVGTYFFSGGLLAILTCIMEFILGNTFPAVFFGVFGGYFLSFGATLLPSFNAYIAYADPTSTNPSLAAAEATQVICPLKRICGTTSSHFPVGTLPQRSRLLAADDGNLLLVLRHLCSADQHCLLFDFLPPHNHLHPHRSELLGRCPARHAADGSQLDDRKSTHSAA